MTRTLVQHSYILILCFTLFGCGNQAIKSTAPEAQLILVNIHYDGEKRHAISAGGKPYQSASGYDLPLSLKKMMGAIAHDYNLTRVEGWPIVAVGMYCEVMALNNNVNISEALEKLSNDKRIVLAQPLNQFKTMAKGISDSTEKLSVNEDKDANNLTTQKTYNDPYFATQYEGVENKIAQVHQRYSGKGVKIAIIDTGVDIQHQDLSNQVSLARNFVDDNDKLFFSDTHGTAVAGIIAAESNNNAGIVGIAPQAKLQPLKACWATSENQAANCNSFTLAKALAFVLQSDADIVNLSLSGPDDELLKQLIEKLVSKGVIVIAAKHPDNNYNFPAKLEKVISVRTNDKTLSTTDVMAPGSETLTTAPKNRYDFVSGNSMATAYTSGVAALLKQAQPNASTDLIRRQLLGLEADSNCIIPMVLSVQPDKYCTETVTP